MRAGRHLKLTVLGSGTSVGVPTLGCQCRVCQSPDPRDKRLRPSVYIEVDGWGLLIDTAPDLRQQALRTGIRRIDAILYTHAHADHILGLDDVRPFNFHQRGPIPIYGSAETIEIIQRCFAYIFDENESQSSRPRLVVNIFDDAPLRIGPLTIQPIPLIHGRGRSHGFRFGPVAYLTDHSDISPDSRAKLHGLDVLFLDALRKRPHPTHTTLEEALRWVEELRPRYAYLTHICHELGHEETERELPPHVRLAYDGLELTVPLPEELDD